MSGRKPMHRFDSNMRADQDLVKSVLQSSEREMLFRKNEDKAEDLNRVTKQLSDS